MKVKLSTLVCVLLAVLAPLTIAQENISQRFGSYEVFYSALNTNFLSTDVAKAYGVVRGDDKGLINIAVIKHNLDSTTKNVDAKIKGSWSDLIYKQPLEFTRVQEQQAIYYIAPFDIQHKNDMYFSFEIFPEGAGRTFDLNFKKRLYVDNRD